MEEFRFLQCGFIDDDLDALGLDALHDALDAGSTEVVRAALHDEAVDADDLGVALENAVGDEVLACGVGLDDGVNEVLRHILIVGQQLLGVFGQAVAAVAERGIVVVVADARIEADALDDLFGIQSVRGSIGVQFVEVGHAHGEVGIGKQLDRLGFGGVGEQYVDILLDRTLLEQVGKDLGAPGAFADDDARGVKVVVQRTAFTQKFGREDQVVAVELRARFRRCSPPGWWT